MKGRREKERKKFSNSLLSKFRRFQWIQLSLDILISKKASQTHCEQDRFYAIAKRAFSKTKHDY